MLKSFAKVRDVLAIVAIALLDIGRAGAADADSVSLAINSISADELKQHVAALADDSFEGREAGTRGGRAAGVYLGKEYQKLALRGGAEDKGYYQPFNGNCRNILGVIEGSDPELKKQVVVIGAHYDHVGLGTHRNSHGPIGYIHNGADDNASGSAGLVELAQAFTKLKPAPKRTILFALWDSEEEGLFGSKYWLDHPSLPLNQVTFMFNADMIGRLRKDKVEALGCRTAPGLRRFVSQQNRDGKLLVDFTWEMKENSDHFPFVAHNIPVLMLFTGLHEDYHTPGDKAEKLNPEGMCEVTRLYFAMALEMAEMDKTPRFRAAGRTETPEMRKSAEQPLAPLPGRLGIGWPNEADQEPGLKMTAVQVGSAAHKAGIQVGDRLLKFAGRDVTDGEILRRCVLAAGPAVEVVVQRPGEKEPRTLPVKLGGEPVRWGLTWRTDEAEPGCVILSRVVPGSPAEQAGLYPSDRVYQINGHDFADAKEFNEALASATGAVEFMYERWGQMRSCTLQPPETEATK